MSHVRQQIREAVYDALDGSLPDVVGNIYLSRVYALEEGNLPAVVIYVKGDARTDGAGIRPRLQTREAEVTIEMHVKASEGADDQLDDIANNVEQLLYNDSTLNNLVNDFEYNGIDISFSPGDKPVAFGRMNFRCRYVVKEDAPDTAL